MKSLKKVIIVEFRRNRPSEHDWQGTAETKEGVSTVFLNSRQSHMEMINSFFHELAHVWMQWNSAKHTVDEEERIARVVGDVAEPCFRRYLNDGSKTYKPKANRKS